MSRENGKFRKPTWMNFVVVALLMVTTGFTITACVHIKSGGNSAKPTGQSTKQEKKNQPAKSAQQKNKKQGKAEDTTVDDDPE
jgi:hypothetical protein